MRACDLLYMYSVLRFRPVESKYRFMGSLKAVEAFPRKLN